MASGGKTALEKSTLRGDGTSSAVGGGAVTIALTIAYHPDLGRVGDRVLLGALAPDKAAFVSRTEPDFAPPRDPHGAPLNEEHLSRKPLRFSSTGGSGVRLTVGDSGTAVFVRGKRIPETVVFSEEEVKRGVVLELSRRVVLLLHHAPGLDALDGGESEARELVGESAGLRRVLWDIRSVADLDLPVLLRGETGVGKELVARAIHRSSKRKNGPFVAVNLGALAPSLAVAELFGATHGAFTGAVESRGYFEQARGGTLFLDEMGEAPAELQVPLLRALETGELQTVGAQKARKADARIIAATDADLDAKVSNGTFRAPLLHRLSSYSIWIPPLRERRDDIGRLLVRFLREELERIGELHRLDWPEPTAEPWLPSSLAARIVDDDWPGNIRQLRNVVRQLVVGSRGRERLEVGTAVERLLQGEQHGSAQAARDDARGAQTAREDARVVQAPREDARAAHRGAARRKPSDVSEAEMAEALRANRFDLLATAKSLNVSRASIYMLLERYPRFRKAGDLTPEEIRRCHEECRGNAAQMVDRLEVSEHALRRRLRELKLA